MEKLDDAKKNEKELNLKQKTLEQRDNEIANLNTDKYQLE